MRKRNCRVEVYLTKDELDALTKKVRKTKLSREGFLRRLINEAVVKEAPPAELTSLIWELRRVGNNINQILLKANAVGFLDAPMLRRALDETHTVEKTILEAYTMPEV